MPKVAITEEQRRMVRYERRSDILADGLAAYKRRQHLNNEQMAAQLGIGKNTITRLLNGEDVKVSIMTYWHLLEVAKMNVKREEQT